MSSLLHVNKAAVIIRDGGIVIYPTETFWAIGCNPQNPLAVAALYRIKARNPAKPMPLLASSMDMAAQYVDLAGAPPELFKNFWPGPLSLLLPVKNYLAPELLNPQRKAALRISACVSASRLSELAGCPIVATSANLAGFGPARNYCELDRRLFAACEDSGLPWGVMRPDETSFTESAPSTLVEACRRNGAWRLTIMREGALKKEKLAQSEWFISLLPDSPAEDFDEKDRCLPALRASL